MNNHFLKAVLLCGAMALGSAGSAYAAATSGGVDGHEVLPGFTAENIARAANAIGYTTEQLKDANGGVSVGITGPNGVKLLAQPADLIKGRYTAVLLYAIFNFSNGAIPTADVLNTFNNRYDFTTARNIGSKTYLVRMEIADFGIPLGNLASSIKVLGDLSDALSQYLTTGQLSASAAPPRQELPVTVLGFAGAHDARSAPTAIFTPTAEQGFVNTIKQ